MFKGDRGVAVKDALALQLEVGKFFGARRFVPVANVHMMGDIEVMGDSGKAFVERVTKSGARCVRPTTTNARCIDFDYVEKLKQDPDEAHRAAGVCFRRHQPGDGAGRGVRRHHHYRGLVENAV